MDPPTKTAKFSSHRELFSDISIDINESLELIFNKFIAHGDWKLLKERLVSLEQQGKSDQNAKACLTKGDEYYKKRNLLKALLLYNISICYAPRCSYEFAMAVGNRSAVLYNLNEYEECLKDINVALRAEYPKDMLYKIHFREAKCLFKLRYYSKVAEALAKTEIFLAEARKTIKFSKLEYIVKEIEEMACKLKSLSTNDEFIPTDTDVILPKPKNGEHPTFPSVSKAIEVRVNEDNSRCYVADSNIKKGDVLFVEKSYTWTPSELLQKQYTDCHYCLKEVYSYFPCVYCTNTFFCSDKCRQIYWNLFHKWECVGFQKNILTTEMTLAIKLLIRSQYKKQAGKTDNIFDFNIGDNSSITTSQYSTVDLKRVAQDAALLTSYLSYCTLYVENLYWTSDRHEGSLNTVKRNIAIFIFKCLYLIEHHSSKITHFTFTKRLFGIKLLDPMNKYMGLGIYSACLHISKSWEPNAIVSFSKNIQIVKAIKTIKRGAEIEVSYTKHHLFEMHAETGQMLLKKDWSLCPSGTEQYNLLYNTWVCPNCGGHALSSSNPEEAECSTCHHSFPLVHHKLRAKTIATSLVAMADIKSYSSIEIKNVVTIYELMKATYYKYCIDYCIIYRILIYYYRSTGDLHECLKYGAIMVELTKKVLGDTSALYVASMLKYGLSLAYDYTSSVSTSNSTVIKEKRNLLISVVEKARNALRYHVTDEVAETYVNNFMELKPSIQDFFKQTY